MIKSKLLLIILLLINGISVKTDESMKSYLTKIKPI